MRPFRSAPPLAALAALACAAAPAAAQSALPVSLEARADVAVPVGAYGDVFETGVSLGATVALRVAPRLALYAGWERADFGEVAMEAIPMPAAGVDDVAFVREAPIDPQAWKVGGRAHLGAADAEVRPFVHLGAVLQDGETGVETGLGGSYALGGGFALAPMIRWRRAGGVEYLAGGLGVSAGL